MCTRRVKFLSSEYWEWRRHAWPLTLIIWLRRASRPFKCSTFKWTIRQLQHTFSFSWHHYKANQDYILESRINMHKWVHFKDHKIWMRMIKDTNINMKSESQDPRHGNLSTFSRTWIQSGKANSISMKDDRLLKWHLESTSLVSVKCGVKKKKLHTLLPISSIIYTYSLPQKHVIFCKITRSMTLTKASGFDSLMPLMTCI